MSNVHERMRSVSKLEFWKVGVEIRTIFVRYLMNENKVPKRWRPVMTFPGIAYAMQMMDSIIEANSIYPTTTAELEERRILQNRAIGAVEKMLQHIPFMTDTLDTVKASDFERLTTLLIKESNLLRGWKKQNKLLTSKKG